MTDVKASKGLGWFSIGLGLTQVLAPGRLGRLIGVGGKGMLMQALGVRELATGVGILARPQSQAGLWARVAGDVMDVGLLATALRGRGVNRARIAGAAGMVLAVGVLDFLCARQLRKH